MDLLPTLFGIACCLTILLAKGGPRLLLAVILAESWAISNVGWQWDMLAIYPVLDLVIACAGYALWHETRTRTMQAFTRLAFSQLILHVIYAMAGDSFLVAYLYLLDVTFALELLVVSWRGLVDALDYSRVLRWVYSGVAACFGISAAKALKGV